MFRSIVLKMKENIQHLHNTHIIGTYCCMKIVEKMNKKSFEFDCAFATEKKTKETLMHTNMALHILDW